jgi:hypothetical protein
MAIGLKDFIYLGLVKDKIKTTRDQVQKMLDMEEEVPEIIGDKFFYYMNWFINS